jgi:predicted MFS family arabinose efflux permease
MQQVRLVAAAPPLAPASVALNTSVLYVGQAIGSFVSGLFYARDLLHSVGFVGAIFVASTVALVVISRPRQIASA